MSPSAVPSVRALSLALACAFAFAGCASLTMPEETVPEPVAELPPSFARADTFAVHDPLRWWTAFEDPVLNRLIDSTLVANLDLAEAVARVEEAEARARVARAPLLPSITGTANANQQDQPGNTGQFASFGAGGATGADSLGGGGGGGGADRIAFTTYTASLAVSYDLDFWGRARSETNAAVGDLYATGADLQTARLSVLAQAISTYFEVVDLRHRIALTEETLGILEDRLAVTEARYQRGLTGSFELYAVRQDFQATQANLPALERQRAAAEGRLAVVAGRFPGELDALLPDALQPQLSLDAVPSSLPTDLLIQRPDVRAAAYRFEAARYRVGAARAQLFPTISLSGSLGLTADEPSGLLDFDQWISNFTAGITAPLFQGGRLRANVEATRASYERLGATYARSVMTAYQEVDAALAALAAERERYQLLQGQLDEAVSSSDLQRTRVERGVGDVVDYLDAVRNELGVRTTLAQTARSVALARLDVHRALGGGWTEDGALPEIRLVEAEVALPEPLADRPAIPVVTIPAVPSVPDVTTTAVAPTDT